MGKDNQRIARQITIGLITGEPNDYIAWFNDLWSLLNVIETDVYHNDGGENIYIENDIIVFYYDSTRHLFFCDYYAFWRLLRRDFDLDNDDVSYITKAMIDNIFNKDMPMPIFRTNPIPMPFI